MSNSSAITHIFKMCDLDGIIHPDTCSAIMPLYSVPVSLLLSWPQLENVESWMLNPSDSSILTQELSWQLYPLGHAVMRQEFSEKYSNALGPRTHLATEQWNPFLIRAHLDSSHHESSSHYNYQGLRIISQKQNIQLILCKDPGAAFVDQSRYWKPPWLGVELQISKWNYSSWHLFSHKASL